MTLELLLVAGVILIGIIFIMIEIFLLPGVSLSGIAGGILLAGGIIYSYLYVSTTFGHIALAASIIVSLIALIILVRSKSLRKIALKTEIRETVDNSELSKVAVGDCGKAISRLNPMGKVMVNNTIMEAKTLEGVMIDEDTEIVILKINSNNVIVKKFIQ